MQECSKSLLLLSQLFVALKRVPVGGEAAAFACRWHDAVHLLTLDTKHYKRTSSTAPLRAPLSLDGHAFVVACADLAYHAPSVSGTLLDRPGSVQPFSHTLLSPKVDILEAALSCYTFADDSSSALAALKMPMVHLQAP